MEKFIPYEKLSKKKKRELDKARRGTWGELSPVTRKAQSAKVYDERKSLMIPLSCFVFFVIIFTEKEAAFFLSPR